MKLVRCHRINRTFLEKWGSVPLLVSSSVKNVVWSRHSNFCIALKRFTSSFSFRPGIDSTVGLQTKFISLCSAINVAPLPSTVCVCVCHLASTPRTSNKAPDVARPCSRQAMFRFFQGVARIKDLYYSQIACFLFTVFLVSSVRWS